jgi:type IV pilus assembly protein PilC
MYTTTLLAGERSGNLQEVLERYVSFQRISLTFRKKLMAR